jgi:uncharacterized protein (DUF1015 family)
MLSAEQLETARNDPLSFRYSVGRSAGSSHAAAMDWLTRNRDQGVLRPVSPTVFIYRQTEGNVVVTGIIANVSLRAYDSGLVKRHEATITKTQRKMARYFQTTRIYGNPVALAHRPHPGIASTIASHTRRDADTSFTTVEGRSHHLWVVGGQEAEDLCRGFDNALYVTDGHHRLAAASLVAAQEGERDASLPAGLFSTQQVRLRSFARCVVDPELDADAVVDLLRSKHHMDEVSEIEARPRERFEFGAKIRDRYYRLRIDRSGIPDDAYGSLDVNLLQDQILGPIFGINDPRHDRRLRFVADLSDNSKTDTNADAWLLPFPTAIGDVMAVADAGRVMPPKSTWFAPKLPSGIIIRPLDAE